MEENLSISSNVMEGTSEQPVKELFELCQAIGLSLPVYEFVKDPDTAAHAPSFKAICTLPEFETTGFHNSKKLAKQVASANMIKQMISDNPSYNEIYQNKILKNKSSHLVPELGGFNEHPERATTYLSQLCERAGSSLDIKYERDDLYRIQLQTKYGTAEGGGGSMKEAIESASRIILENLDQSLEVPKTS